MNNKQKTPRQTMRYAVDVDRRSGDVRTQMFGWAQQQATCKEFLLKCFVEEQWVKSIAAGDSRVESLPACWTQAKSDIKRAWEQGFEPRNFESASQHRDAKLRRGKGVAATKQERERKPESGVAQLIDDGVLIDAKAMLPDDLRHIARLIRPLNQLSRARVVKSMTAMARKARLDHDGNTYQGQQRATNDPRNKGLFPGIAKNG